MQITFEYLPEFEKEFKKLCKKYTSLNQDFEIFEMALKQDPKGDEIPWILPVSWLWSKIKFQIYKVKKFRCFSINKNSKDSGIRIIYTYHEWENKIEFQKLEFIEIYHKNDRSNHDSQRIKKHYSE